MHLLQQGLMEIPLHSPPRNRPGGTSRLPANTPRALSNTGLRKPKSGQLSLTRLRLPPARATGKYGIDVQELIDPEVGQATLIAGIAFAAVGFIGTFFIAPNMISGLKEPNSWVEIFGVLKEESSVTGVDPAEAQQLSQTGAILVDVRMEKDYGQQGFIEDSINLPLYRPIAGWDAGSTIRRAAFTAFGVPGTELVPDWALELEALGIDQSQEIIICDETGGSLEQTPSTQYGVQSRSLKAAFLLHTAGYTNVKHLEGGVTRWEQEGLDLLMYQ